MRPFRPPPIVLAAAMLAAMLAAPSRLPAGPLAPTPAPEEIARGHLARAREYGAGSVKLEEKCDPRAIDGYYAAVEAAWNAVWTCPGSREILCEAAIVYADALEGLLATADAHGRIDGRGLWLGSRWKPTCVPIQTRGLPVDATAIDRVVATPPPGDSRITRRHVRGGFGLPVSLRVKPATEGSAAREYAPARQSLAATAVLRFKMPGDENALETFAGPLALDHAPAILDLANPVEIAAVRIGPARPMLAADLTAPLLDMLEAMPRAGISGFLQPFGQGDTQPRLEFLQPHQPGRIPVVFIHGLASDEGTWFDMLNELQSWPTFHRRFEPWVYHYPTGASFAQCSAILRQDLQTAVQAFETPQGDPALRSMVLVGHSMGGLHAKLQVVSPGTTLWDAVACKPFSEFVAPPRIKQLVGRGYFFEPLPFVRRVVFIATPHRGSTLASLGVGRAASLMVQQPAEIRAVHQQLTELNPGALRPEYEQRLPTTVDMLQPSSGLLQAIESLRVPCWVSTHSIVGNSHASLTGDRDDCVVAVSSAHTPGAVSEIMVPASHTRVHHHPLAIQEVQRILIQHLQETGLDAAPQRPR